MDINVLTICITAVVCLLVIGATTLACFEKYAEMHRPRSLAEVLGGLPRPEGGDEDE